MSGLPGVPPQYHQSRHGSGAGLILPMYRDRDSEWEGGRTQKGPCRYRDKGLRCIELAPTYSPGCTHPVPSALAGLTTLFGMGRGGTPPPKAPTFLSCPPKPRRRRVPAREGGQQPLPEHRRANNFFFDKKPGRDKKILCGNTATGPCPKLLPTVGEPARQY